MSQFGAYLHTGPSVRDIRPSNPYAYKSQLRLGYPVFYVTHITSSFTVSIPPTCTYIRVLVRRLLVHIHGSARAGVVVGRHSSFIGARRVSGEIKETSNRGFLVTVWFTGFVGVGRDVLLRTINDSFECRVR